MTALPEPTAVQSSTTGAARYPGVLPFGDTPLDWLRFFGREEETQALLHQLLSVDLLVLFGRSGVGKTSLLKAALFPLLRKRDFLPLPVRFNESGTPLEIVQNAVGEACKSEQIDYTAGRNGSLWEFFKTAIFWRDDRIQTPVLLLDQFEEVFTIQGEEFRRALAAELGQLTTSRLPEHLRPNPVGSEAKKGAGDLAIRPSFTEKPPEMKILIGLREDYLGALQEFAQAIPGILLNRSRLTGLSEENARRAIIEPAILVFDEVKFSTEPFTYTEEALGRMIAVARDDEEGSIEPFVLQILCSHVERRVRDKQTVANSGKVGPPQEKQDSTSNVVLSGGVRPEVDFSYLGGEKEIQAITINFYLDALKRLTNTSLRRRARSACEEELLTGGGRRLLVLGDDLRVRCKLPQQAIDMLVDARLLRKEPRHGSSFYEISHDRIAEAIHHNRRWRMPREVKWWVGMLLVVVVSVAATISSYQTNEARLAIIQAQRAGENARLEAERAKSEATRAKSELEARQKAELAAQQAKEARDEAEQLLNYLLFDLRDRLVPLGRRDILEDVQKRVDAYYERMGTAAVSGESLRQEGVAYSNRGDLFMNRGNLKGALSSYQKYSEISEKLAAGDPTNTEWQRDLSVSCNKIGDVQSAQGDLKAALSSYHKGLEIREKLAAGDPASTEWQRDLSVSYDKIGDVQSAQGDLKGALGSYQKELEISEKLAAGDQSNTEWQRDLSVSYNKIGNVQRAQGDLKAALSPYQKGLEIREKLAAGDPASTEWQRDLSVSHNRIGDVQRAQGDLKGALSSYQKGLEISEKLAAGDPTNTEWQRDLSISYERVGDVQSAQGDLKAALSSCQMELEIRQKLAAHDPTNTQWQTDLVLSLWRVAILEEQEVPQKREAVVDYQRALDILRPLAAENRLTAEQKTWISQIEARLKGLK